MEYGNVLQTYKQSSPRMQFQILGLFLLGLILVAIVAGLYLNITARAATYGRRVQVMQSQIQTNERLSADLESSLARQTSADIIAARAKELGFIASDRGAFEYVKVPGYNGREPATMAPPPGPVQASEARLPEEFTESLIDWVRAITLRPVMLIADEVRK